MTVLRSARPPLNSPAPMQGCCKATIPACYSKATASRGQPRYNPSVSPPERLLEPFSLAQERGFSFGFGAAAERPCGAGARSARTGYPMSQARLEAFTRLGCEGV
jgi:hypothetical protein